MTIDENATFHVVIAMNNGFVSYSLEEETFSSFSFVLFTGRRNREENTRGVADTSTSKQNKF